MFKTCFCLRIEFGSSFQVEFNCILITKALNLNPQWKWAENNGYIQKWIGCGKKVRAQGAAHTIITSIVTNFEIVIGAVHQMHISVMIAKLRGRFRCCCLTFTTHFWQSIPVLLNERITKSLSKCDACNGLWLRTRTQTHFFSYFSLFISWNPTICSHYYLQDLNRV